MGRSRKRQRNNNNSRYLTKVSQIPKDLKKYWVKRYMLFSKFDEGVALTRELWYSVTPEDVAINIAEFVKECLPKAKIVVDGFSGGGGNSIQFAKYFNRVVAIDNNPSAVECLQINASVYQVQKKIDFILDDFDKASKKCKADAVFISPPWGGPKSRNVETFDLNLGLPYKLKDLLKYCRNISENVIMFLPRNSNVQQLAEVTKSTERCRISYVYLNGGLKGICAFWGSSFIPKTYLDDALNATPSETSDSESESESESESDNYSKSDSHNDNDNDNPDNDPDNDNTDNTDNDNNDEDATMEDNNSSARPSSSTESNSNSSNSLDTPTSNSNDASNPDSKDNNNDSSNDSNNDVINDKKFSEDDKHKRRNKKKDNFYGL